MVEVGPAGVEAEAVVADVAVVGTLAAGAGAYDVVLGVIMRG